MKLVLAFPSQLHFSGNAQYFAIRQKWAGVPFCIWVILNEDECSNGQPQTVSRIMATVTDIWKPLMTFKDINLNASSRSSEQLSIGVRWGDFQLVPYPQLLTSTSL